MAIKKVAGGTIPGQPLTVDGGGQALGVSRTPQASTVPPGAHGAVAPKTTHVMATERQGARVNPAFTNGGMTPNGFPYRDGWAVESGTHA
jgi:hypothetical protein